MPEVDEILNKRGATYGAFQDNARIAQTLKRVCSGTPNWNLAEPDQQEALDMFCSKMSRLLTGDISHLDSWQDIAGYATLVADRLAGKIR